MQVGENREREGYALVYDRTGFYSHGVWHRTSPGLAYRLRELQGREEEGGETDKFPLVVPQWPQSG